MTTTTPSPPTTPTMAAEPASPLAIVVAIAELTLRRLWRGRALWVSVLIALLPVVFAAILKSQGESIGDDLFVLETLVLAVLPPMFVSSSIGEEIEDRTTTYLWSRALPRWTIIVGKLFALVPIVLLLVLGNWMLAMKVGDARTGPSAMSFVGLAAGAIALAILAAGIATLVPKHGMALTVCYILFFDVPIGALPASLRELSITHHMRMLAEVPRADDSHLVTLIALTLISGGWLAIAFARIRRIES